MLKVIKFAYRHSIRSGKWDVLRSFKMGMEVYNVALPQIQDHHITAVIAAVAIPLMVINFIVSICK